MKKMVLQKRNPPPKRKNPCGFSFAKHNRLISFCSIVRIDRSKMCIAPQGMDPRKLESATVCSMYKYRKGTEIIQPLIFLSVHFTQANRVLLANPVHKDNKAPQV